MPYSPALPAQLQPGPRPDGKARQVQYEAAIGSVHLDRLDLSWRIWTLLCQRADRHGVVSVSAGRLRSALTTGGRTPKSSALRQAVRRLVSAGLLAGDGLPAAATEIVNWQLTSPPVPAHQASVPRRRDAKAARDAHDLGQSLPPQSDSPPWRHNERRDPACVTVRTDTPFERAANTYGLAEHTRRVWRVVWGAIVAQLRDGPAVVDHPRVVDQACDRLRHDVPDATSARVLAWAVEQRLAAPAGHRRHKLLKPLRAQPSAASPVRPSRR